jgi:hypothetical protein
MEILKLNKIILKIQKEVESTMSTTAGTSMVFPMFK